MSEDFLLLSNSFKAITGLDLSHYNRTQIQRRLSVFQQKYQLETYRDLLAAIQRDENLLQECLQRLTINVTEFYRDSQYWDKLREYIIDMARVRLPLRLWSAGCATGEEAYSLSAMLSIMLPKNCWEVLASDLDAQALATAKAGLYREKSLKNLSTRQIAMIFNKVEEDLFSVKERVREKISFLKHDLLQDDYPRNMDIILCRNVLIYFKESTKKAVLSRLSRALNPNGLLFVGSSEQIINPEDYGLRNENIFFYKKLPPPV